MRVSDVISIGNKIDIRLSSQVKKQKEGGEEALVYRSAVNGIISDSELEILMPTLGGRMVLFHMGAACDFFFYAKGGMYTTTGIVRKRYRRDGTYLIGIELTGTLVKFQRREYFRVDYVSTVEYSPITMRMANRDTIEGVREAMKEEGELPKGKGNIQDVSGGGIQFSAEEALEPGSYLIMNFRLTNKGMDESFDLVGQVVTSHPHERVPELSSNRVKFLFKDLRDREKIVRFVFEEERRIRKKRSG